MEIIKIFVIFFVFLIVDSAWLKMVASKQFGKLVFDVQGSEMKINMLGAIVSYILLALGTYHFGFKRLDKNNILGSLLSSATLFGLITYGVFDFTNLAIFKEYDIKTGIIDTLWGGAVTTIVTFVSYIMINKLYR